MPVLRHVYDPTSGTYHDVEVTQEVYDFYRRNAWAIRRNNTRFYAHEIQFSSLAGGEDGAFETFNEFVSFDTNPELILRSKSDTQHLWQAFCRLPASDQHLLYYLIIEGRSERWYGERVCCPQRTINHRKRKAVQELILKYLENNIF